jgi:PAS domain S-box-containing protein
MVSKTKLRLVDFIELHDLSSELYCVVGKDRLIIEVSGNWYEKLRYTPEEAYGKTIAHFIHPDDLHRTEEYSIQYVRAGRDYPGHFENRLLTKDGQIKWFRWKTKISAGTVYAVAQDITEEREAKNLAKAAERRLFNIIGSLEDTFVVMSHDLRYIYINSKAEEFMGPKDKVVGKHHLELYPDETHVYYQALKKCLATKQKKQVQGFYTKSRRIFEADIHPVDEGLAIYSHDITENVTMANELRVAKERLELALNVGRMGIWNIDLKTGQSYWSAQAQRIFGYDACNENRTFEEFKSRVHPEDWPKAEKGLEKARKTGHDQYQFRIVLPSGQVRWIAGSTRVLYDESGQPNRLTGINVDITDQKEAEVRLIENDKLAAMGTLAAGVAHEINNPLTYVMTNLDLLAERMTSKTHGDGYLHGNQANDLINKISDGTRRIKNVVQELKNVSRRDDDKPGKCDLNKAKPRLERNTTSRPVHQRH